VEIGPRVVFCEYRDPAPPLLRWGRGLVRVLQTRRLDEVLPTLAAVEEAVAGGLHAAGFLAYEAAPAMDGACRTHAAGTLPLVWFALFREMVEDEVPAAEAADGFFAGPWRGSITPAQHRQAVERIKDYIARGHTYQVNYTFRLRASFQGDPWEFFLRLCRSQRARYGAYLDNGQQAICSASPELFFSLDGEVLTARPMKGTAPRGLTSADDRRQRQMLAGSLKDRAENAMIVDMMRNDLGRVARRGSVRVVSAMDVEKYPTVLQMTSTVAARTSAALVEILRAAFPPASITGAPKFRTMEIIRELETGPRGVYTGSIGYLSPGRQARFNVAIRTVAVDRRRGEAEYGVGGGIVWDSVAAAEYAECETKAAVLTAELPPFELLETLLYEGPRGYFLLERHLRRLAESAEYFDFAFDPAEVCRRLDDLAAGFHSAAHRVRLCVGRQGRIALEAAPLPAQPSSAPWRLRLAQRPIDCRNVFLYHKTTCRSIYEAACSTHDDCDDIVLWNERGEATETTIANLVVRKEGRLATPPVRCGLLPGTFRAHLLETGEIAEEVVTLDDLRQTSELFAVNSVRKWLPAVLVG
jgi:para-aminobenzoate synthetase/4-amino-4-deoxychorismate lyase